MINYRKIFRKIDKKDIISFDVFDTLIVRLVNKPSQIFDIVQKEYNNTHDKPIDDFKIQRIIAEKNIIDHIPNIDDIYDCLSGVYSKTICDDLKKIELSTELKYCICNEEVKIIYDYCRKKKKTIYAISDMYIPKELLQELLKQNGYYFDRILVSCDENANKKSSMLFKRIDSKERINMLHIGDSIKADYLGARLANVSAIRIRKRQYDIQRNNIEALGVLKKRNSDYFYNLGFDLLGPLLLGFAFWLNDSFKDKNINKIYFFSREGKIFMDVFNELYESKYKTKYLYVSRKTMTVANYKYKCFKNLKETLEYFTIKKDSTVSDFERYLDIEIKDILEKKSNIYDYLHNDKVFITVSKILLDKSEAENSITKKYFKQEGLFNSFAIVDIGWNGTMQKCMEQFLENNNINNELKGYYFCTFKQFDNSFSYISRYDSCFYSIKDNPVLIENFFQTIDGSTVGYRSVGNNIVPVKKDIEFNEYSTAAIKDMDEGILDFIRLWKKYGFFDSINSIKKITNSLDSYIKKPKFKDIKKYYDFCYSDIKNEYIISKSNNIKYGLISSAWKYGYLKKIIKLPINYQRIVKILKRGKNGQD